MLINDSFINFFVHGNWKQVFIDRKFQQGFPEKTRPGPPTCRKQVRNLRQEFTLSRSDPFFMRVFYLLCLSFLSQSIRRHPAGVRLISCAGVGGVGCLRRYGYETVQQQNAGIQFILDKNLKKYVIKNSKNWKEKAEQPQFVSVFR